MCKALATLIWRAIYMWSIIFRSYMYIIIYTCGSPTDKESLTALHVIVGVCLIHHWWIQAQ